MSIGQAFIQELEEEAKTTRRVLERVPGDHLAWKPHAKSMSLGQLALHVASTPGGIAQMATQTAVQVPDFRQDEAKTTDELFTTLDEAVATAKGVARRPRRCGNGRELEGDGRRSGSHGSSSGRTTAVDHAQPLVSPPGPTLGLSPTSRCARALDLRAQR